MKTRSYRLTRSMWLSFAVMMLGVAALRPANEAFMRGDIAPTAWAVGVMAAFGALMIAFALLSTRAEDKERHAG